MFTVADLRQRARARLPRMVFDFIDGGAGDEASVVGNRDGFKRIRLIPKVLCLGANRTLATHLLGHDYAAPFGVAPMGIGRMAWPDTDEELVRAAASGGVPYSLSTVGSTSIERIAELGGYHAWFQIYLSADPRISTRLMDRARNAGVDTLVVTVDANNPGRRLRDLRNRFGMPFRFTPAVIADFMRHPRWSLSMLRAGTPRMVNLESDPGLAGQTMSVAKVLQDLAAASLDWSVLEQIRAQWPGKLIVKGVMHPDDALHVVRLGADAISVSNHGGRQLGSAVSPIEMLPQIRAAVGPDFTLLLDSGVRGGEDIAKALALGANFVLLGRPFLFAAAALGGAAGGPFLIELLKHELSSAMAQLGCARVGELDSSFVYRAATLDDGSLSG